MYISYIKKFIEKDLLDRLPDNDEEILREWIEGDYQDIQSDPELQKQFLAALNKMPTYNGALYRGLSDLNNLDELEGLPLKVGSTITFDEPTSATKNSKELDYFSIDKTGPGKVAVQLYITEVDDKAKDLSKVYSEIGSKDEVILLPGSTFRVIRSLPLKAIKNRRDEKVYVKAAYLESI
jgi:hypothetical protein